MANPIFVNLLFQLSVMYIHSLSLLQFKNYLQASLEFLPGINCFTGNNGSGKTNILDAIYYLSFCKGFSNAQDILNILLDQEYFLIQGKYEMEENTDELYCAVKRGQKKVFKRNKKEYDRLSDHIGLYPLVLIFPGDVQLILGGSEERRKFVDSVIAQFDKEYLYRLLDYNKALQQRNALLKQFAEKRYMDEASLEIWDYKLIENGKYLYEARQRFFGDFRKVFQECYQLLSGNGEQTDIRYESDLEKNSFDKLLKDNRKKDLIAQYTSTGIHKDNLVFLLQDQPLKKFGSQGQQKTYVISLKLAQYAFIREIKKMKPILLFDDIFDKLDPRRVGLLLETVSGENFGQVFITDTHKERLENILGQLPVKSRMFEISHGEIASVTDISTNA